MNDSPQLSLSDEAGFLTAVAEELEFLAALCASRAEGLDPRPRRLAWVDPDEEAS